MAFSGLHVACCYTGQPNVDGSGLMRPDALSLPYSPVWSEVLAAGGTSGQASPGGGCILRLRSSVDLWVAFGPSPDATKVVSTDRNTARVYLAANSPDDYYVKAGDKVNCAAV